MAVLRFPERPIKRRARKKRTRRIAVMMSLEEENTLDNLALAEGVTRSDYVRRLVRAAYRRLIRP